MYLRFNVFNLTLKLIIAITVFGIIFGNCLSTSPLVASPRTEELTSDDAKQIQVGHLQASAASVLVATQSTHLPPPTTLSDQKGRLDPEQIQYQALLETASIELEPQTYVRLKDIPKFSSIRYGSFAGVTPNGNIVYYTVDPQLQTFIKQLTSKARANHVAIAIMEPFTGRILALTGKSSSIKNIELHGEFPAASIFKIITSAAALEQSDLKPDSKVSFRGGNYTLNYTNYQPDSRRDNRSMTVTEALGRSCNPVFARVALNNLETSHLRHYAAAFGFNSSLGADLPVSISTADIPEGDYQVTRTAAGFGHVTLNPLHAAALMSSVANGGILPRPRIVQRVITRDGKLLYYGRPQALRRSINSDTAGKLLQMLETTTTIGTSRREFMRNNKPVMGKIRVAAKTGTLSGQNPPGLNNWFIAAAPIENPQIVVAVVVVDAMDQSARASAIGRKILEHQLLGRHRPS